MSTLLPQKSLDEIANRSADLFDEETLLQCRQIVNDVRQGGQSALLKHAIRLGDLSDGADILITKDQLKEAYSTLAPAEQELLQRTASRISDFAIAQRNSLSEMSLEVSGAAAGQQVAPVNTAGCYAPGGRYPLPSSVLMTACTARAAGVRNVIVASPKPTQVTLAAAEVAGATSFLAVGGAQAIAALAYGAGVCPPCDIVVGPGNRWVTAAKYLVSLDTGIDMLAGPSELVVVCDKSANAEWVAADLIAQAEHDVDAFPVMVSTEAVLIDQVRNSLESQLSTLSTAETAREALQRGASLIVEDIDQAAQVVSRIAPEHLQLSIEQAAERSGQFDNYGALFVGERSAEVLCDYGAGPNHVLPTAGSARFTGGLSVFTFLRIRTWLNVKDTDQAAELAQDAVTLAQLEGLAGHAEAARLRTIKPNKD